jgi:hypothetical protein
MQPLYAALLQCLPLWQSPKDAVVVGILILMRICMYRQLFLMVTKRDGDKDGNGDGVEGGGQQRGQL